MVCSHLFSYLIIYMCACQDQLMARYMQPHLAVSRLLHNIADSYFTAEKGLCQDSQGGDHRSDMRNQSRSMCPEGTYLKEVVKLGRAIINNDFSAEPLWRLLKDVICVGCSW